MIKAVSLKTHLYSVRGPCPVEGFAFFSSAILVWNLEPHVCSACALTSRPTRLMEEPGAALSSPEFPGQRADSSSVFAVGGVKAVGALGSPLQPPATTAEQQR